MKKLIIAVLLVASVASANGTWFAGNFNVGWVYGPFNNYYSCSNWASSYGLSTGQLYTCRQF